MSKELKILITGASGMLGLALAYEKLPGIKIFGVSRSRPINASLWSDCFEVDILNFEEMRKIFEHVKPDAVIHTAAITNVDACETDPNHAKRVHVEATSHLVSLCKEIDAKFVYISTDIFYDSKPSHLAKESDSIAVYNVYAQTKLEGERAALTYSNSLVLRTNIFGFRSHGTTSFGEWVLKGLKNSEALTMFTDVFITPISTHDLSKLIYKAIDKKVSGLFNVGCSPAISKYDFAVKVGKKLNLPLNNLIPTKLTDKNLTARRPTNLSMDSSSFEKAIGEKILDIDASIELWLKLAKENVYESRK